MGYQTFDNCPGASKSSEKWQALRLPKLTGMRVLDIGCNEGYFCNRALEEGAAQAVGVDINEQVIEKARKRFPNVEFYAQTWVQLPDGPFDLILLLSSFHYAKEPVQLLENILERLSPSGLFVFEIGMITGRKDPAWEEVHRTSGPAVFPTFPTVEKLLAKFAFKFAGKSVMQAGDPCPRFVFHCCPLKPMVLLVGGESGSGKTTLARSMDLDDAHNISLDRLIIDLSRNGPKSFVDAIKDEYVPEQLHEAFLAIRRSGILNEFLNILIERLPTSGVILIEGAYISSIESLLVWRLQTKGYAVWGLKRKY